LLQRANENERNLPEFSVDRFLTLEDTHAVRNAFKSFTDLVSTLAKNSDLQKNASLTMYNILLRNKDHVEAASKEADSYIGQIEKPIFHQLTQYFQELFAVDRKREIAQFPGSQDDLYPMLFFGFLPRTSGGIGSKSIFR
jgi:hypothetical protein